MKPTACLSHRRLKPEISFRFLNCSGSPPAAGPLKDDLGPLKDDLRLLKGDLRVT